MSLHASIAIFELPINLFGDDDILMSHFIAETGEACHSK